MSATTRTNTLFTLPGVSQYARTGSFNTVADHSEIENHLDIAKDVQVTKRVCEIAKPSSKELTNHQRSKSANYHELEVQLMMKDRMIEELLEENGKLVESMNRIEQDKIDETSRIQQGTEMILQQVVEDNEWYKAQFLEMKNELEKAILQTRNKGREINTLERRCKNLIDEKETIQNFLDELTVQYDERVDQLQRHSQNISSIGKLVKKYLGRNYGERRHKGAQDTGFCSINEIIDKIKHILSAESNSSKIKHLVDEVELNTLNFEAEICEILDKINCKSYNNESERVQPQSPMHDENNLKLNEDYQKVNVELENAKNEIKQLKNEISRKAEIIEELKNHNKNVKLDILESINNSKEDSKMKFLEERVALLESEKHELIKKIANFNRNNINKSSQANDYINRKLLVITQEEFSSNVDNNTKICKNEKNSSKENPYLSTEDFMGSIDSIKDCDEDPQESSISVSDIIDKYIKYPIEYNNAKKQIIQRNSIQRNRYY
ncbi:putative coiled coil-containing protein [Cryptosporidium canis]|uniref:Coiled coil-containing protein n=1 Tax=Cryptosporidium canis TaxID=195482 RepID=A0A9D5HVN2_9CRYT|nr:putative coiled coil-containing protein [Cryptosporidium canis]